MQAVASRSPAKASHARPERAAIAAVYSRDGLPHVWPKSSHSDALLCPPRRPAAADRTGAWRGPHPPRQSPPRPPGHAHRRSPDHASAASTALTRLFAVKPGDPRLIGPHGSARHASTACPARSCDVRSMRFKDVEVGGLTQRKRETRATALASTFQSPPLSQAAIWQTSPSPRTRGETRNTEGAASAAPRMSWPSSATDPLSPRRPSALRLRTRAGAAWHRPDAAPRRRDGRPRS